MLTRLREQHLAHLVALARDGELKERLALDDIGPGEADELGDAQASRVEHTEQHAIAFGARGPDQELHVHLGHDALGKGAVAAVELHLDWHSGHELSS